MYRYVCLYMHIMWIYAENTWKDMNENVLSDYTWVVGNFIH